MTPQRVEIPSHVEARGLLVALLLLVTLTIPAVWATLQPVRRSVPFRWETLTVPKTAIVLQQYLQGAECAGLLQQAQIAVEGQYASAVLPRLGTFEVQARQWSLVTVRPLTAIGESDGCRFNPRYVGSSS